MHRIAIHLPDELLVRSTSLAHTLGVSRAAYIREAIAKYNRHTQRELLAERFRIAVEQVREDSAREVRELEVADAPLPDAPSWT